MSNSLYERDFYAWATEQAALLRAGHLSAADVENIAEEIDSMGRSERRELTSRLTILLTHLLKWQMQADRRGRSWLLSIVEQRGEALSVLEENPSLRSQIDQIMATAYTRAVVAARRQTKIPKSAFPAQSPWTFDQAINGEPTDDE